MTHRAIHLHRRHGVRWNAGVATVAVAGAAAMTSLAQAVTTEAVFAFYIGAVALTAWTSGRGTAIGVVIACCVLATWPMLMATGSGASIRPHGLRIASFSIVALLVAFLTGALRDARNHAERVSLAKDRFLAAISHEFRTPLNAVLAYADLLDEGVAGPLSSQQRLFVQRVHAAGFHLLTLVEDILDAAKMDAGRMAVRNGDVSLRGVIERAAGLVEPQAQIKGIRFRLELPREPIVCHGDPHRIRQIVVNLLSNAVKFTPPSGEVTVAAATVHDAHGARACVHVSDTGPGVAPEDQERIFQPFEQAGDGSLATVGSGLGLSISRRLAAAMGGTLTVASQEGQGSTFTLSLRCRERRAAMRAS